MTADQRLNQLEPLVAQTLAVVNRHTEQLQQLVDIALQHSDSIEFVLRELSGVRTDLDELKHKTSGIQQSQSLTGTRIGGVENAVSLLRIQMTGLDTKLDRILGLLDKS